MENNTPTFTLRSNELNGQFVKKQFGMGPDCQGGNISPELHWENAPAGTRAFAVTMHDLDAPTGSGLWHWVVYNIPLAVTSLDSDAGSLSANHLPEGAVGGLSDLGIRGYFGPCPPSGEYHRYIITVYALKQTLEGIENSSAAIIGFMLNTNAIEKASLAIYARL